MNKVKETAETVGAVVGAVISVAVIVAIAKTAIQNTRNKRLIKIIESVESDSLSV